MYYIARTFAVQYPRSESPGYISVVRCHFDVWRSKGDAVREGKIDELLSGNGIFVVHF